MIIFRIIKELKNLLKLNFFTKILIPIDKDIERFLELL